MKKLITIVLAASMLCGCLVLTSVSAEEGKSVLTYPSILNAIVNNQDTAIVDKAATIDEKKAVKVVPNTASTLEGSIALDSWDLGSRDFDLEKYGYAVVSYKYDTKNPSFTGNMKLNFLTGGGALTKTVSLISNEGLVAGEWATATFCFKDAVKNYLSDSETHILRQMHFMPFGATSIKGLKDTDVIYIESFTLYAENPNPDFKFTTSFAKGDIKATGNDIAPVLMKSGETYTVPECPYTLNGATFTGWLWSYDSKEYKAGEVVTSPETNTSFTAKWELEKKTSDTVLLQYPAYFMGNVNKHDLCTSASVEYDGMKCVKIAPNPASEKEGSMALDCWEYARANVDLDVYKYMQITYKYESDSPKSDVYMGYNIMPSGVFEKSGNFTSNEPLEAGSWTVATFDISEMSKVGKPDVKHVYKQAHLYPFGTAKNTEFTANDVIYVSQLEFFKENPGFDMHKSFIKGYSNGTFRPSNTMTRAEACTIVARLVTNEAEIAAVEATAFTDVAKTEWYFGYIAKLEALGYLKSYSGEFKPNQAITRAEFVELVYNMGLLSGTEKKEFSDVAADHPRHEVIALAGGTGLVGGYPDGSFKPDNTITRAEVVKVINNANGVKVTSETPSSKLPHLFSDLEESHWAFYEIMEAAVGHSYKVVDGTEKWHAITNLDIIDFSEGNAYVAELDKKTADRIAEIRATKSEIKVSGTSYYMSDDGNDANDGKTPETAWKSIDKINTEKLASGDGVFFRRGDTFRGAINAKAGVTYAAYGEGAKPLITPSPENAGYKEAWIETDVKNVYKYHNPIDKNVGAIVCNVGENVARMVLLDEKGIDRTSGKAFAGLSDLMDNYFWHDGETQNLYFRCDKGNPGEIYDRIELNVGSHGARITGAGAIFDNLCIMYAGAHGISGPTASNLIVTNCEFGYIGGSKQGGFESSGRYGNAVEIYGGCNNYQIRNCYVYQVYDAGITHQVSASSGSILMKDITYDSNVIECCTYNIEYFLGKSTDPNAERRMENVAITNNILRNAGYGWGYQRPDRSSDASVKGWSSYNRADDYIFENNIIDRARCVLIHMGADYAQWLPKFKGNTYVQYYPAGFIQYGQNPVLAYAFNGKVTDTIEKVIGDKDYSVYFVKAE